VLPCRFHRTQGPWALIKPLGCGLHPATTLIKTEAAVALAPRKETHTRLRNFYTTGSDDTVLGNRSGDIVVGDEKMCVRGRNVHVRACLNRLCESQTATIQANVT